MQFATIKGIKGLMDLQDTRCLNFHLSFHLDGLNYRKLYSPNSSVRALDIRLEGLLQHLYDLVGCLTAHNE